MSINNDNLKKGVSETILPLSKYTRAKIDVKLR